MCNDDGIGTCESVRRDIERQGYVLAFTSLYCDPTCPDEILEADNDGWAIRRALKQWAKANNIADFRIFRATDYLHDLYGSAVYEMYIMEKKS